MKKRVLVSISREFGSGGHDIGKIVGRKLGIPVYDADLLKKVCEEIHKLCDKAIQKLQELTEKGPDKLQARCIDDEGQLILHLQTSNYVVLRDLNMKKD